jgi:hypothetical protein
MKSSFQIIFIASAAAWSKPAKRNAIDPSGTREAV